MHSQPQLTILVVDDEPHIRNMLVTSLTAEGHQVSGVTSAADAIAEASRTTFDVAFVDLRLESGTGLDLIPRLLSDYPWIKIVAITAHASVDTVVEAMKRGAADYLAKPFTPAQVRIVVDRLAQLRGIERRVAALESAIGEAEPPIDLDSAAASMARAIDMARQVAPNDVTVLISGESGTGKGVLARAIHSWSGRADKVMSTVSCPTISPRLLESELFGHAKGAFTDAIRDNAGRIAASEGGTLFLDEIGDMPLGLQPKLLRFLQDREYERIGESITRRADVRVISATNVDLVSAVRSGKFREDLFYRINVIQIQLPPLRERTEDIMPLAEKLLVFFGRPRHIAGFTTEARAVLKAYAWPGNVRELRNVVERAAILCRGGQVGVEHLPSAFVPAIPPPSLGDLISLEKLEESHIRRVLAVTPSLDRAAELLGINVATLYRKRKKYRI